MAQKYGAGEESTVMGLIDDAPNDLTPAVAWIGARGGTEACARDTLKMTAGDGSAPAVRAALVRAKAPSGVHGLIGQDIYWLTQRGDAERIKHRAQVDEGDASAPYWQR